jgi:hypothetical protein
MADDYSVIDKTFSEIKRLTSVTPFQPFRLRADGVEIVVDHPTCIGFHPEVPFLTVHTRRDIYKLGVENVVLIRESY